MSRMGNTATRTPAGGQKKSSSHNGMRPPAQSVRSVHPVVDRVLALQRTIGNQAVQRLLKNGTLQAKLRIGQPGDIYEREADRVAEQVMQMAEPSVQRQPLEEEEEEQVQTKPIAEQITPLVQRQVEEEEEEVQAKPIAEQITPLVQRQVEKEEEKEELQTKASSGQVPETAPNLESRVNAMRGSGQPLPDSTRAFFERGFGYDFSHVRVHTDGQAAEIAQSVNATAFAVGSDVIFGAGHYAPNNSVGRRLLAHELTHVVQQAGGGLGRRSTIGQPVGRCEPKPHQVRRPTAQRQAGPVVEDPGKPITRGELKAFTLAGRMHDQYEGAMTAYGGALLNFGEVLKAPSKKGIQPDIGKVILQKAFDESVGLVSKRYPGLNKLYSLVKDIQKEFERAKKAKARKELADFFVNQNTWITKRKKALDVSETKTQEEALEYYRTLRSAGKQEEYLRSQQEALAKLEKEVRSATPESVFALLSQEWIRRTKTYPHWSVEKPAFVLIRVDKDWTVRNAEIKAPGGQKIAEKLLELAGSRGVEVYGLKVPRRVMYFEESKQWYSAVINVDESGKWQRIGSFVEGRAKARWLYEQLQRRGLPPTKNLTGD